MQGVLDVFIWNLFHNGRGLCDDNRMYHDTPVRENPYRQRPTMALIGKMVSFELTENTFLQMLFCL